MGVSRSTRIMLSRASCVKPNKQASTVSWFGKSGSRTTDGGDSIRTLSRTAKSNPLARNENDSGEGVLEVPKRTGFWW